MSARPATRLVPDLMTKHALGSGLLGVGLLCGALPGPAAASAGEPGTITPRVALRTAVQDGPVPAAALQAPSEESGPSDDGLNFEPSVGRGVIPAAAEFPASTPGTHAAPAGTAIRPAVTRDDYRAAYHAVPFSLAEYRANPGYRHAVAMKFLTGEYPPPTPVAAPAGGAFGGAAVPAVGGFGVQFPARGFPGLALPGGFAGPPTAGPPPFAFDRVQGVVPTFVNRYQTPRVFLPRR